MASAKGSPGVTTTAWVLASVWPTDVILVDGDAAGGDLALLGRTPERGVLDPDRGLLSLAADARRGLAEGAVGEHLQRLGGGLDVLCGVASPDQMTGIGPVWPALAGVFADLSDADVIVDCGRIVPGTPVMPVVSAADVLVMVARPHLESFAHLRERLRWLAHLRQSLGHGPAVGVVVISEPGDKRSAQDLTQLLARDGLAASVLGGVAQDQRAADVVAGRLDRGIDRSLLVRSVRQLVEPVRALAATGAPTHVTD